MGTARSYLERRDEGRCVPNAQEREKAQDSRNRIEQSAQQHFATGIPHFSQTLGLRTIARQGVNV
jgi:hypothetical protein